MWGWFWKRHAATDEKNLLRRIADGKITKSPPRKRWGPPRYQEKTVTLPVLGPLPKRDLTDAEILMLGDIRRGAMHSDRATEENATAFHALSRMDVEAGELPRTRPIITRRRYYSAGIPAADQATYMSKVTYAADGILGRYWDSRNKVDCRGGKVIGDGPLFQIYLKDGFASYLRGPKKPLYVMVLTEGHVGCMILTVVASSVAVYLCVEAFNLAPTDVYEVTSGIRDGFRSQRHSLYQMIMQVPVRHSDYDKARLFMRALGGTITEPVVRAFPNGRIANDGRDVRVQTNAFDLHCQTWIVVYPILRLVMRKSLLMTSRWFDNVVVQHGHRFIDEARAILVELAADPPRALQLIKKSITMVAEEDPKLVDFSTSLFRVERGGAPVAKSGIVPGWENRSWLWMEGRRDVDGHQPMLTRSSSSVP